MRIYINNIILAWILIILPLNARYGEAMEYFLKGEYAKLKLDFENAIIFFDKASKIDSNSVIIYSQLADCYRNIGDLNKAKIFFNKTM